MIFIRFNNQISPHIRLKKMIKIKQFNQPIIFQQGCQEE